MSTLNNDKCYADALEIRVDSLLKKAASYYVMPFSPPKILLDISGSDAGQALPGNNTLRFNPSFLRSFHEHYLKHVAGHEVAHLVSHHVFGRKIRPHGKEWAEVMTRVFELPAIRCHSYDLKVTGRYPYLYRCDCPDRLIPLSSIRHRRTLEGTVYLCQHCRSRLVFSHVSQRLAGKTVKIRS